MKKDSHIFIAELVLDEAKKDNIILNERMFKLGSITPDYSPRHKMVSHYYRDSIDYIEKLMSFVLDCRDYYKVSFHLGVIVHYITDYFTSPHFNYVKLSSKSALSHIRYEMELDRFIKEKAPEIIVKRYTFEDIRTVIEREMEGYNNKFQFLEDIKFATETIVGMMISAKTWGIAV